VSVFRLLDAKKSAKGYIFSFLGCITSQIRIRTTWKRNWGPDSWHCDKMKPSGMKHFLNYKN